MQFDPHRSLLHVRLDDHTTVVSVRLTVNPTVDYQWSREVERRSDPTAERDVLRERFTRVALRAE